MLTHLVITADDFGLAVDVNIAVEMAHRNGILSAASLMVGAPAADDAVRRARTLPRLAVGLHVVLVDGAPTLPPDDIPDLLDKRGLLRNDLAKLGLDIAVRPKVHSQLRKEIRAQFEAFAASGLALSHVDVHKHYHLHPIVAADIISIGREFGIRSVRVPYEPRRILKSIDKQDIRSCSMLAPLVALLKWQAHCAGLLTADAVFGWSWSGALNEMRMVGLVSQARPEGLTEIYCHPAISDDFEGHAPGYGYRGELEALLSTKVAMALNASGFRLSNYERALRRETQDDSLCPDAEAK
ncbi:hopanoid biosynthesis-associated protein HpnK [Methylocystis sp. IM3]|uniref:hopanoid biosynthesis-associated protein HpnK n=1 Tax=unclassified Methylocystis TaxID=2625913 RepID=UPI0030FA99E2